jgi:hypothetical protein
MHTRLRTCAQHLQWQTQRVFKHWALKSWCTQTLPPKPSIELASLLAFFPILPELGHSGEWLHGVDRVVITKAVQTATVAISGALVTATLLGTSAPEKTSFWEFKAFMIKLIN